MLRKGGRALADDPLLAWLAALAAGLLIAFLLLVGSTKPVTAGQQISLTELRRLDRARAISGLTLLDQDRRLIVVQTSGARAWVAVPDNSAAIDTLLVDVAARSGAPSVKVDAQTGKEIRRLLIQVLLPILILVTWFSLFMRLAQRSEGSGVSSFSRWRGGARNAPDAGPNFASVAGAETAVSELRELVDILRRPDAYSAIGARPPKGTLLVGPPGTGKTLLARALAGETGSSFFVVSGSEFVESLVGIGAARIRDLFRHAREHKPAIVFIDELDAVGRRRGAGVGQGNDEREQTLNQLLVELDGFDAGDGLIVLAATNRPDILDPALLRPGRFDRQVHVDTPDLDGRTAILDLYLTDRPVVDGTDVRAVASRCPGFTGADLENVVNEAALLTVRAGMAAIGIDELLEGIERTAGGARDDAHVLGRDELRTVAVHEAGHAVVAAATGAADLVQTVSIVARGRRLGRASALLVDGDRRVMRRSDLDRQLTVTMAGAAAESEAFGELSTAVNEDLHTATQLARGMVTSYGMSDLGPVTIGERSAEVFLGAALQELDSVGNSTLERIDEETRRIVSEARDDAAALLRQHWVVVEDLAGQLLERETLTGPDLASILDPVSGRGTG